MSRICGSLLGFLSNGLTTAVLKASGTEPEESDLFIILRIGPFRTGKSSLKSVDGIGSNIQVVGFEAFTKLVKVSGETISNWERVQVVPDTVSEMNKEFECELVILLLIEPILFVKKLRKSSALKEELLTGVFCVSLATVSNRKRGLFLFKVINWEKCEVLAAESACL